MKVIAEIAKTKSIVQKENTLIDIKFKLNLQSLDPCTHKSGLTTIRLPVTTKTSKWSRFASVNKTGSQTQLLNKLLKNPRLKTQIFQKQPIWRKVHFFSRTTRMQRAGWAALNAVL